MIRKLLIFLIILILNIIQVSFLNLASDGIAIVNIMILFLVTLVFSLELIPFLWWSLVTGVIIDLFSPFPFGTTTIVIITTSIILQFLFKNFLTNRSLYTFVLLSMTGTLVYNFLLFAASYLLYSLNINQFYLLYGSRFWIGLIWQIVFNTIIAVIIFFSLRYITNRFQKQFLISK